MGYREKSREIARLAGRIWYMSLRLCPHRHMPRRYTVNGSCVECALESAQKAYKKDREDDPAVHV
jgi:hypothetical protein